MAFSCCMAKFLIMIIANHRISTTLFALFISINLAFAQTASIKGKIIDQQTQEPIPFANVVISGTQNGTSTDFDGLFTITNVNPGYVKLEVSVVGYERTLSEDVYAIPSKTPYVEIKLKPTSTQLKEVVIETSKFRRTEESPVSLQTLGIEEIEKNPGGARDISRAIQSLPGVASTPSFRNDIIIRGGAPNENRFYVDEVETPIINHFQTQGSSGGPAGILNVNLVREVNLYTGAFPSNRGNALSSVLEFKQLDGNQEKLHFRGAIGSSDLAIAADGPLGDKTTFIASYRFSYLQLLFSVLGLPILPQYQDYQFKVKHKFNKNNEFSIISLGALDQFSLDLNANDGVTDPEQIRSNNYILGNTPINNQWNYTIGGVYKHYSKNSFQTVVLSRNMLNNVATKYQDNDESDPNKKILEYGSREQENKLRVENTYRKNDFKFNMGFNFENVVYSNNTFNRIATPNGIITRDFVSELDFLKYGIFGQASQLFFKGRLTLSLGFRMDGANYNTNMSNLLNQFSPRLSGSYAITDKWSFNFNTGRYFQLTPYTVLGYRNTQGDLVNKNNTTYIQADHYVSGVQYNPNSSTKITVEGFYKDYQNYPFLLTDSISLANLGADFGVIGNEPTASINSGRAYGVEFLIQRRAAKGLYGILAYTFVRSEFKDKNNQYVPSSWDSQNFVTLTAGKKFKNNWEAGIRWRYAGGLPYTPFDVSASSTIQNWNITGAGIRDFDLLNSQRLNPFSQLDVRVDKTWFLPKTSINLYIDIQNVYNAQADQPPFLDVVRDDQGNPVVNPLNPGQYQTQFIANTAGTVLPTIGVIVDF